MWLKLSAIYQPKGKLDLSLSVQKDECRSVCAHIGWNDAVIMMVQEIGERQVFL